MKEISEINKKINATTGQAEAVAPVQERRWAGPNFRNTPEGGFQWVNPDLA